MLFIFSSVLKFFPVCFIRKVLDLLNLLCLLRSSFLTICSMIEVPWEFHPDLALFLDGPARWLIHEELVVACPLY